MENEVPTIERETYPAEALRFVVPPRIIKPADSREFDRDHAHDIQNILPDDFTGKSTTIEVPPYGFIPDGWSRVFLRGLSKLDVSGKTLLEPGVGTGINAIHFANRAKEARPKAIWAGDYDDRMAGVAARNADRLLTTNERSVLHLCEGELSLIAWAERHNVRPDIVYGCLPQVPRPHNMKMSDGDAKAHYYEKDHHEVGIDDFGLGLQVLLLQEARDLLAEKGSVVLNLGGRPGLGSLKEMFERNQFNPEVLHAEIVQQHAGTDLEPLAIREHTMRNATEHEFEFFGKPDGTEPINAVEAHRRKQAKEHVYHYIYVIQATMQ